MIYHKGIWWLPVLTLDKAGALHHKVYSSSVNTEMSCIPASNQYRVRLDLATDIEPVRESTAPADMELVTDVKQHIMQLLHDHWNHPSNSKMERIIRYYKMLGFPPGFLKELKNFKCKVCTLCKGERVYKHTKRLQEKMKKSKCTKASKNWAQVLLEEDLTTEKGDDILNSFGYWRKKLHVGVCYNNWEGALQASAGIPGSQGAQNWPAQDRHQIHSILSIQGVLQEAGNHLDAISGIHTHHASALKEQLGSARNMHYAC
eukprot:965796-Rhodomonas_salina.1